MTEINEIDTSQASWFSKFSPSGRNDAVILKRILLFAILKYGRWP